MLPILRSVYHRGGRSIGSRRNLCSSPGSTESIPQGVVRKCLTVAAGYVVGYFKMNGYARKLDETQAENLRKYEEELRQVEEIAARRRNLS